MVKYQVVISLYPFLTKGACREKIDIRPYLFVFFFFNV